MANCETDRRVIKTLGSVLAGSTRPFIVTSGTAIAKVPPGELAREDAPRVTSSDFPRAASEEAAADAAAANGVNVSVVRLPQVHDPERQGLISPWIMIALAKGRVRLCRGRTKPVAGRACQRRRPALPARGRKGGAGRGL